ncbi:hypothetical protein KCU61_g353, partial [Aureobasidium melanogenum]
MMPIAPSDVAAKVNFAFVDIVTMEADGRSKFGLCGKERVSESRISNRKRAWAPRLGGYHQHPPAVGQQPLHLKKLSSHNLQFTMSAQNSAGIQTLLDAEREAQKIVQQARECNLPTHRTKRVKDARSEAQKEIDEYRNKKEEEFKQFSTQHTSGNEQAEKDATKDTDEKLKEIKSIGDKEGPTVIENLLRAVTDVKPQVPEKVEQPLCNEPPTIGQAALSSKLSASILLSQ